MTLRLYFLKEGPEPLEIDDQFMATFGRSTSADIFLDEGHLSSLHGEFYMGPDGLVVRDLGSKNGLFINGQKVEEGLLVHGDRIGVRTLELFELVDDTLPQMASKGLALTPNSMSTDLVPGGETGLAASNEGQKSVSPQKGKPSPFIIGVGVLVAILVILALFSGGEKPTSQELLWTEVQYKKNLDQAGALFLQKEYLETRRVLERGFSKYDQNNAAQILFSLAGLWQDKGDLYQTLKWGRVQRLAEELLDAHPSTVKTEELARKLLLWIRREEPHVADLQKMLWHIEAKKWDRAEALANKIPEDCSIKTLYESHILEIEKGRLAEWKAEWEVSVEERNWAEAERTLLRLKDTSAAPEALEEKLAFYDKKEKEEVLFNKGKTAYQASNWEDAESFLSKIIEGETGYSEAQSMLASMEKQKKEEKFKTLVDEGELEDAISWINTHFSDRKEEIVKLESLRDLVKQARNAAEGEHPEDSLSLWKKVLKSEVESEGINKEANKAILHWTSPMVLTALYLERGKLAEKQENYEEAKEWYRKANELDGETGEAELKDFERQAWLHFNRAMVFDRKGDLENTQAYLRKALQLTEKHSKLYDRIEIFTREKLGKKEK